MISSWVRPDDTNLLVTWTHFTAPNGERFLVRALTREWEEDCMDILHEFFSEDPLLSGFGLPLEPASLIALHDRVRMYLKQQITYGCFLIHDNGEESLVAVDVLYVRHIMDNFPEYDNNCGKAFKNYMNYIRLMERHIRYTENNRYCSYLTSFGVITRPNYRDHHIERNMIRLRQPLDGFKRNGEATIRRNVARKLRIELIGSVFIGKEMQSIAQDNKYLVIKEFTRENLLECDIDLGAANVFPIRLMRFIGRITKYNRD